jgi:isoleucyl-tRNA synthetase
MEIEQWGYPYVEGSKSRFEQAFPAQFICEALDQTRGWFYTLMAVNTLVFDRSSYEHVLCLGLIMAEDGRKMSKHLGNILEPLPLMDDHGADALRWFMACTGSPWGARRVGPSALREIVRKVLLTYWNTAAFLALYARAAEWTPASGAPERAARPTMDRWALAELDTVIQDVTDALDGFDAQRAGQRLATFVDDLSNWYVRRSRRRFWAGDPSALATLHTCLEVLTRLLAPITPFLTERVWQDVVRPVTLAAAESVHLASWPKVALDVESATGPAVNLPQHMALIRRLVELGRAARAESGFRTRQPLRRALVIAPGWGDVPADLQAELAAELNVGAVETLSAGGSAEELVEVSVKPQFRSLGKRFGQRTQAVAAAIGSAPAGPLATALRADGRATIEVGGEVVELEVDDVTVHESPRAGWTVASAAGETIGLDLAMTPDLVAAGIAREVVREVQELRKSAGLEITDRILLRWHSSDAGVTEAIQANVLMLADEVLATVVAELPSASDVEPPALATKSIEDLGLRLWLDQSAGPRNGAAAPSQR